MLTSLLLSLLAAPAGGTMETLDVLPGTRLLVAAPHGGFDRYTDEIARRTALLAGGGYLLAMGYRLPSGPINVNRPTEGVGLTPEQETVTPRATAVFDAWRERLVAQDPALYVEIHGNSRKESAHHVEVAVVGIDAADAAWIRDDFAARLALLPPDMPRLPLAMEPLEPLHYRAMGSKTNGALRLVPRALHFELPYAARGDERVRGRYADCLASTLVAYLAHTQGVL